MFKKILSILAATIWISISEFLRNQFVLNSYWVEHYQKLGLTFPAESINGAVWGIWSLCYAISIYFISRKYSFTATVCLSWFIGFVLMWLVIGNLLVLPFNMLPYAIPWSIVEALVASFIIYKITPIETEK